MSAKKWPTIFLFAILPPIKLKKSQVFSKVILVCIPVRSAGGGLHNKYEKTMIRVESSGYKTMIRVESMNSKTMIRDFHVASSISPVLE